MSAEKMKYIVTFVSFHNMMRALGTVFGPSSEASSSDVTDAKHISPMTSYSRTFNETSYQML